MSTTQKLKVAIIYGGKSGEHDISRRSARHIIEHLDQEKYELIPIGISEMGQWFYSDLSILTSSPADTLDIYNQHSIEAIPHADPTQDRHFDVAFPILHGKFGEDGTLQGLLELADIPYIGCGVLASAICMDKDIAKRLVSLLDIPVPQYYILENNSQLDLDELDQTLVADFGYPVFVKPANAGSSDGVSKVTKATELTAAVEAAFTLDKKILIEQAISARDIEISVLEALDDEEPLVSSVAGEVINVSGDFYSKSAKFDDKAFPELQLPADLTDEQLATIQEYAQAIFIALECKGLARVDFFIDKNTCEIFFNEINTMPGFNLMSLYPKMWEASGLGYAELLDHLIALAIRQ